MLYKTIFIFFKNLFNYCDFYLIHDLLDISIKTTNRYCDYAGSNLWAGIDQEDDSTKLQNKNFNIFKYLNFNNIIILVFTFSGVSIIVFYLNDFYLDLFLENIQKMQDFLNPPHKPNKHLILLKVTKDFLFYKESDIPRINNFMFKRLEDFFKSNGKSFYKDFYQERKKGFDLEEL